MAEELFRFVVARPPRSLPADEAAKKTTEPYAGGLSPFAEELRRLEREASNRANAFIESPRFVRHLRDIAPTLAALDDWLLMRPTAQGTALRQAIRDIVGQGAVGPNNANPAAWRERLADSLLAVTHSSFAPLPRSQHLIRGLRLVELVARARADIPDADLARALTTTVVLPSLKKTDAALPPKRSPTGSPAPAPSKKRIDSEQLYADLRRLRQRYETKAAQVVVEQPGKAEAADAVALRSSAALRGRMRTTKVAAKEDFAGLSETGRALLEQQSLAPGRDLSDVVAAFEFELENIWHEPLVLGANDSNHTMGTSQPHVPVTRGQVRLTGIGDLMLVRQRLKCYDLGEIAHIENVLPHEHFERVFRRKDVTETFEEEETEKTESSERELQTTSKSELKAETEKTIEEDLKFEAGVNVTYRGGMVEVNANADFGFERSTAETNKTSTTHAREVVDRSVSKLQERVLKRRSVRVQREVEDTSTRGIDNSENESVVGIYRWVDKINQCEIVNYGRRQLVEFLIPEPAAFYRHLLSHRPVSGVTATRPEPPAYLGTPLAPGHINEYTYLTWVAQYNVTGVEPPPPYRIYIGVALEQGRRDAGQESISKVLETGTLKVSTGYQAAQIRFDYAGEFDSGDHYWEVIVGNTEFKEGGATSRTPLTLNDNVPVSMVAKNWGSFTCNIIVECTRLDSHLAAWRIATFNAIMNRYERLRSEYEEQVEAQRVQQLNGARTATNPQSARDFERAEVKRASIMLLTGQAFDLFGSTVVSAAGPTDVNFDDAAAEGSYIQFIEQAFEWRHMSYAFYPYYWGRKGEWSNYALNDDVDALFAQFLRAGAARVVVSIRPGFFEAVRYFLKRGKPWNGGEPPDVEPDDPDDPPYITIAQELAEQLGVDFVVGEGKLRVEAGSAVAVPVDTGFDSTVLDRELRIDTEDYRVVALESDGSLRFDRSFAGSPGEKRYGIGPRIVGIPWEVRLPTTLVMLDGHAERLPNIPSG